MRNSFGSITSFILTLAFPAIAGPVPSVRAQVPPAQRNVVLSTVVNIRNGKSDWTSTSDPARPGRGRACPRYTATPTRPRATT
jgi:hypothetical protein